MSQGKRQPVSYIEGMHRFEFEAGYEVCRIECSGFYSKQTQNFCGGGKEVDFMLYHPGKRELWLIEVKDYRFDARPKVRELINVLCRKVKDSLFLLRTAAVCSPEEEPLEGMSLRRFSRLSADALTVRLAFLLELNSSPLFPEGSMLSNIHTLLLGQMRFIDENLVCAPITFPGRVGPWRTFGANGELSKKVEERRVRKETEIRKREEKEDRERARALKADEEFRHEPPKREGHIPMWKKRLRARQEGRKGNHSDRRRR